MRSFLFIIKKNIQPQIIGRSARPNFTNYQQWLKGKPIALLGFDFQLNPTMKPATNPLQLVTSDESLSTGNQRPRADYEVGDESSSFAVGGVVMEAKVDDKAGEESDCALLCALYDLRSLTLHYLNHGEHGTFKKGPDASYLYTFHIC